MGNSRRRGELNEVVHDRPMDEKRLTASHRRLSTKISKLDLVVRGLEPGDPRKIARQKAEEPLSSAQYRFVQLLSASVSAADVWDMLRIASEHIEPAADRIPPNPYDDIVAEMPAEAVQAAEDGGGELSSFDS